MATYSMPKWAACLQKSRKQGPGVPGTPSQEGSASARAGGHPAETRPAVPVP